MFKIAYNMGRVYALEKLGMGDYEDPSSVPNEGDENEMAAATPEEAPPEELLPLPPDLQEELPPEEGGEIGTSEDFAAFAQEDESPQMMGPNSTDAGLGDLENRKPNWGGRASLEAGDAGTRTHEMGLPSPGAV